MLVAPASSAPGTPPPRPRPGAQRTRRRAADERLSRLNVVSYLSGGGVETYGDTFPVLLPTVGWTVRIAARYHERKKSKSDRRLAVEPDVRVDLTSKQYFAKVDPVLDRALKGF